MDPVYVFLSGDPLLLERAANEVRAEACPEAARAFNYDVIDGRGAQADRVLNAARTLPMMAQRRLVELRDVAAMAADELKKLLPYLDNPSPETVLLCTASKADKRVKFFAEAKKRKWLHELSAPRNVVAWLRDEAKQQGVRIEPAAVDRLADAVGKDLARLALSLGQLALYAGNRPVTPGDVEDLIATTRESTVFELTDAIGEGDRSRAMAAVRSLFDQRQSAIGVIVMLARHMRQLLVATQAPRNDLPRALGVPPFIADKLGRQARRFSAGAIDRALIRLHEADFALKGGRQLVKTLGRDLGERVIVEQLVGELLGLSR